MLGRTLPEVGPEGLAAQPVELLDDRLAALAGDPDGARDAPRRAALLARLRDAGLGPLLDDLRSRRAGPDEVDGELDLAWWTSVLESLIRTDQRLARHDGAEIVALGDRVRDAHASAVSAARAQLRRAVAEHARAAVRAHPEQARWLLSEVHRGHRSQWPADLFRQAGDVVAALRPVWVLSPDAVARLLPPPDAGRVVDVVVVDDAGQVGFPEVAAALARGRQVLAAGDRHRLPPATGGPSVLEVVAGLDGVHRCTATTAPGTAGCSRRCCRGTPGGPRRPAPPPVPRSSSSTCGRAPASRHRGRTSRSAPTPRSSAWSTWSRSTPSGGQGSRCSS